MKKLVRDKIISKIQANNEIPEYEIASGNEKLEYLFKKLLEEALELQKDKNMEELADVEEVIFAIYKQLGWNKEEVEKIRKAKLEKNGGFEIGYILKI